MPQDRVATWIRSEGGSAQRIDPEIPLYARAVIEALRFSPRYDLLEQMDDESWRKALAFCDRTQLTLALGLRCRDHLPEPVRRRIARNLADNTSRWERIKSAFGEAADALEAAGVDFTVLKGFSHAPQFAADPRHRTQYDLDLLAPRTQLQTAREAIRRRGYEQLDGFDASPIDHLPAMVRKTGWRWRGDYFDPKRPLSIELHFRLWDRATEQFAADGVDEFRDRIERRRLEELSFDAFHPADALGYAALHILRHLLRGDLRPSHVYELAWFLDSHVEDDPFWREWNRLHPESLRRLEALCFAVAEAWFGCALPEAAIQETGDFPSEWKRWIAQHAQSPLIGIFRPNKDEVWLHWTLVDSPRARFIVLRRRLLPAQVPRFQAAPHLAKSEITLRMRIQNRFRQAAFLAERLRHHVRASLSVARSAARWFLAERRN